MEESEGSVAVRKAGRAESIYEVLLMKLKSRTAERLLAHFYWRIASALS